jgi:hypothetical protein
MELLHSLSVDVDGDSDGNKRRRTGGVGFEAAGIGVQAITACKLAVFAHRQRIEGVIVTKRTGSLQFAKPRTLSAANQAVPLSDPHRTKRHRRESCPRISEPNHCPYPTLRMHLVFAPLELH